MWVSGLWNVRLLCIKVITTENVCSLWNLVSARVRELQGLKCYKLSGLSFNRIFLNFFGLEDNENSKKIELCQVT